MEYIIIGIIFILLYLNNILKLKNISMNTWICEKHLKEESSNICLYKSVCNSFNNTNTSQVGKIVQILKLTSLL